MVLIQPKITAKMIDGPRELVPLGPGGRKIEAAAVDAPLGLFAPGPLSARGFAAEPGATTRSRIEVARVASPEIPPSVGMLKASTLAEFEALARRDDVPGAAQVQEVKFLMTGIDGPNPKMYLINTKNFDYHYEFASQGLGQNISLEQFNGRTYFTDNRKNIAGTLVYHDSYKDASGKKGLFALEFWPTDPVKAKHVTKAFEAMKKALPFAAGRIAYHPAGDTQERLLKQEAAQFKQLKIKTIDSRTLFKNVTYSPMNQGEGFGMLRVIDPALPDQRPATARDVVIFKSIPNDLSHVAGIITEAPQTPLSHVNLKAKQNKTPNAYLKDASTDPRFKDLIGKYVYYKVGAAGLEVREATQAEVEANLEKIRPPKKQTPPRSLLVKHITPLSKIGHADAKTFGAKAANVGELQNILPPGVAPDGYAVPFSFYDRFMKETGLYTAAKEMIADPGFKSDPEIREKMLGDFRKKVKKAAMPAALATELKAIQEKMKAQFGADQPIRCRSSTNNEDLPGFNGAGLYDSFTHRPDEGDLDKTIKQVFASMWNFRAFEERDFYRVDHFKAAMGVLLHPNQDDELANGVAYTKNIYDPNWPGFYVNAQVGESLVTNPDAGATPDEFLISRIGEHGEYETQYIARSSLVKEGESVLAKDRIDELVAGMEIIQAHFKKLYGKQNDPHFAMDIEFKVRKDGSLQIKQARPTVD